MSTIWYLVQLVDLVQWLVSTGSEIWAVVWVGGAR
jgi:hypothetical protein